MNKRETNIFIPKPVLEYFCVVFSSCAFLITWKLLKIDKIWKTIYLNFWENYLCNKNSSQVKS